MRKYVLHRFIQLIPVLIGITFLSFAMMRMAGSDAITELYGDKGAVPQEVIDAKRAELAIELQQAILDDNAYVFCSFLQMNMISKANVTGWTAHACDYYEVTADLDIN